MLPSSQVKTENLIFHKLNLEIIVRLIKPTTHYHWSPRDPIANPSHDDDGGDDDDDGDDIYIMMKCVSVCHERSDTVMIRVIL